MRRAAFLAMLGGLLLAAALPSRAFVLSNAGLRGGLVDPDFLDGTALIGGHLEFEERGSHLHLQPNLLYWSSGRYADVNTNLDVYYHFGPAAAAAPYLGAGLGIHSFHVATAGPVHVTVFDVTGRRVRDLVAERREAGSQIVTWNGRDHGGRMAESGVYYARVEASGQGQTIKLILTH